MREKQCSKCKKIKTEDQFYNTKSKDGLHHYCIDCCKIRWKEYVAQDKSPRQIRGRKEYIEPIEKQCTKCKKIKPIKEFSRRTERANGYRPRCKICISEDHKVWASNKPNASRERNLKSKYGITLEDYNMILNNQSGGCAICGRNEDTTWKYLSVDHCHTKNIVRGILCTPHNKALGLFNDDPDLLDAAATYLRKFK